MRSGNYKGAEMSRIVVPLVVSALLLAVSLPSIQCASDETDPNNPCALSQTEPDLQDLMQQKKNFAAATNTAMANMIGYLYFHGKGYLPLVLSKFNVDGKKAVLASECATLSWNYTIEGYSVHLFELGLEVPTQDVVSDGDTSQNTCRINYSFHSFPYTYNRFSCKTKMNGGCRPKQGESLVDIVMGSLELELSGNPSRIGKGEFSTHQSASGSCHVLG